jgi:hypothetical protein
MRNKRNKGLKSMKVGYVGALGVIEMITKVPISYSFRKGLLATLSCALARHEELLGRKAHRRSLGCARDDKSKRGASRKGLLLVEE